MPGACVPFLYLLLHRETTAACRANGTVQSKAAAVKLVQELEARDLKLEAERREARRKAEEAAAEAIAAAEEGGARRASAMMAAGAAGLSITGDGEASGVSGDADDGAASAEASTAPRPGDDVDPGDDAYATAASPAMST